MSKLQEYIENQASLGGDFLRQQTVYNDGRPLPRRQLYYHLLKMVESFCQNPSQGMRAAIIVGLRGVGKTTLMAQIHSQIAGEAKNGSPRMLYVSLDEVERIGNNLNQLIDTCEDYWGGSFYKLDRPTVLFIDEIQVQSGAFKILKPVLDRAPNLFIFCSGSAATKLTDEAAFAGRRARTEKLHPLSFAEYQSIRGNWAPDAGLSTRLNQIIYHSGSAEEAYQKLQAIEAEIDKKWADTSRQTLLDDYFRVGGLPFLLRSSNRQATAMDIIEKAVLHDLSDEKFNFTQTNIKTILDLAYRLAEATETPSLSKLSQEVDVSRSTLNSMLDALCQTEVLLKVPAWGNKNLKNSGRPAKYHFASPTLRMALNNKYAKQATLDTHRGPLLEDMVALYICRLFGNHNSPAEINHWPLAGGGGSDFILKFPTRRLVIEVGMGQKRPNQVEKTMAETKSKEGYGLVFSESKLGLSKNKQVVLVPLKYFLLT